MAQYVTKIKTVDGDKQLDYNALANLPQLDTMFSNPNLLINGDFQVWQRGTSFSNFENGYTADRWRIANAKGQTYLVEKSNDVPLGSVVKNSMHIVETYNENTYLRYYVDSTLKGDFTLSFWYKTNVTFNSYVVNGDVPTHIFKSNASNTWTKAIINFNATSLTRIEIIRALQVGEVYIAGVKLEYGDMATPFMPKPYSEEFLMCQRFYQMFTKTPVYTNSSTGVTYAGLKCNIPMYANPTVKLLNAYDVNVSQVDGVQLVSTVANEGNITNVKFNKTIGQYGYISCTLESEI